MTRSEIQNGITIDIPVSAVSDKNEGNPLVLEIPYTWTQIPDDQSITVTAPAVQGQTEGKTLLLESDDTSDQWNFYARQSQNGNFISISITAPDMIRAGKTLKILN
jgi:hypothetical protein